MPPGVRYQDLSSLIDFIYNGEVRVQSEDLTTFMALAEQFKVKGLTEDKGKALPGILNPHCSTPLCRMSVAFVAGMSDSKNPDPYAYYFWISNGLVFKWSVYVPCPMH